MKTENQQAEQKYDELGNNAETFFHYADKDVWVNGYVQALEDRATLPAQSSDAVEFAEWIQLNYKKEDGYWFHNSGSSREHDIRDLYSIFLKEKGAHNGWNS